LLYTLNPLVILELTGNLHFEAVMIFFLLLAIYFINKQQLTFSAIAFGFAIGAKLWPIMLMPLLFKKLGFKQTIIYSTISGLVSVVVLFPMLQQYANIFSSLNLYFQQFEFNGSVYYLLRWIINKDEHFETFELMRRLLPVFTVVAISMLSYFYTKDKFIGALQIAFSIYCLFATTMHPWYITPLIMLSVFSGYRYAIVWSLLIYFTYITYIDITYPENYFVVVMEYLVVIGFCLFEVFILPGRRGEGKFREEIQ
jgi:alpha-1,6-mannosyltransferase